VSPSS